MRFLVIVAAAALVGLVGCSSSDSDSGEPSQSDNTADLTITIFDGEKPNDDSKKSPKPTPSASYTLTCEPTGGDHPEPDSACAFLADAATAGTDPFAPVPENTACTRIYGGPQTATVTGTWQGQDVDAQFNLQGGWEIDRWRNAAPVVGDPDDGFKAPTSPSATPK